MEALLCNQDWGTLTNKTGKTHSFQGPNSSAEMKRNNTKNKSSYYQLNGNEFSVVK